jgi:hypothetical protein
MPCKRIAPQTAIPGCQQEEDHQRDTNQVMIHEQVAFSAALPLV